MPFSLANVDWVYVAILALLVFISTWVGSLLSFKNSGRAAVLSALVFAGLFVFWTYYPHRIPGPRTLTVQNAASTPASTATPAAPIAPAAPVPPRNPVTDITPPASPAR
jgi:cytochrome bd-type quinol oxidase subunit 2